MSLRDEIEKDLDVLFFSQDDFALEVRPDTWEQDCFSAIFDFDLVDLEETSREAPSFICPESIIPSTAAEGDLFTIQVRPGQTGKQFKLVDIQYYEEGIKRIVLADV